MKYTNALRQIGLSKVESLIYEALLREGQLGMLALSKATGMNRPALYAAMPRLVHRGVVIEVRRGKRTEFLAASPNKLAPFVSNAQETLEHILDDLTAEFTRQEVNPKIEVYYGKSGIERVFMDIVNTLNKGDTLYRYSIREDDHPGFQPKLYEKIRDEKQIERLVITNEEGKKRHGSRLDRFAKVLKGTYDTFNVTKIIYGKKIAYIDYEKEVAFLIYNERMAAMEKEVFLSLYRTL